MAARNRVKPEYNPHKKPIVQQFKMFKSAGTLSSSFVPASKDEPSPFGSLNSFALHGDQVEADKEVDHKPTLKVKYLTLQKNYQLNQ